MMVCGGDEGTVVERLRGGGSGALTMEEGPYFPFCLFMTHTDEACPPCAVMTIPSGNFSAA